MKAFSRVVVRAVMLVFKVARRACMLGVRALFGPVGGTSLRSIRSLLKPGDFDWRRCLIGPGVTFLASESAIVIGRKVMFGPAVTIIGGDHNTSVVGA